MDENLGNACAGLDEALAGPVPVCAIIDSTKLLELLLKLLEKLPDTHIDIQQLCDTTLKLIGYFESPACRWIVRRASSRPNGLVARLVRTVIRRRTQLSDELIRHLIDLIAGLL